MNLGAESRILIDILGGGGVSYGLGIYRVVTVEDHVPLLVSGKLVKRLFLQVNQLAKVPLF